MVIKMVKLSWERIVGTIAGLGGVYLALFGIFGTDLIALLFGANSLLSRASYIILGYCIINTVYNFAQIKFKE